MGNRFSAGNEEASPEHVQLPQHRTLSTRLRDALNHDTITYQTMAPRFLTMPQPSPSLPSRPDFPSFTVPNLCADAPYDGGDLDTYPERHGWVVHHQDKQCHILCPPGVCYDGIESDPRARYVHYKATGPISPMLSRADGSPVTSATKVAFLQAWLFFGTLHELSNLCGLAVDVERDFLDDDGRSVSTAALNGLAGRWLASLSSNKVGNKDFMERILTIARRMALLLSEEVISRPESQPVFHYTPDHARVFLSMDILLRVLGLHIILHINSPRFSGLKKKRRETERIRSLIHWVGFSSREGRQKLSDSLDIALGTRGWCKSELVSLVSGGMHRFTAVLNRPLARDHSTCELSLCHAYQIDEASYQTAHTDACHSNSNSCDFVPVPTEDLVRKLALDDIPVVVLTEDLEMRVVGSDEYPHIAFSHVWADGRGNPRQNALPRCQLRCLLDYASQVRNVHGGRFSTQGTVAFWMDTLCIPVDPNFKEYRNKAIRLMGRTYREATAVLVLDRELEVVEAVACSFLELGIRTLCSGWMKRLWTLQEASFALGSIVSKMEAWRLYFQMRDGPFYPWDYMASTRFRPAVSEALLNSDVISEVRYRIPRFNQYKHLSGDAIFQALHRRSTSKAEDIPICAASIFEMDLTPILSAHDTQRRIAAFYAQLRSIPEGILWMHELGVERLSIAPFRWAPLHITAIPDQYLYMGTQDITCDDRGLHVRYAGFFVDAGPLCDSNARHVLVSAGSEEETVYGMISSPLSTTREPLAASSSASTGLAILFMPHGLAATAGQRSPNAVVVEFELNTHITDAVLVVDETEISCTVIDYKHFTASSSLAVGIDGHGDDVAKVYCRRTPDDQQWCIT